MPVKLRLKIIADHLSRLRDVIRAGEFSGELIHEMQQGWQNEYGAHPEFALEAAQQGLRARQGILECGSGFTTVLLTVIAQERGLPLVVLEHDGQWAEITRRSLRFLGLPFAHVIHAPLKNFGPFDWFSVHAGLFPDRYDYVLCDGPPGTIRGGRVGLLPVLGSCLSHECVILLDDAGREGERAVIEIWKRSRELSCEFLGVEHQFARLILRPAAPDF